MMPKFRMRAGNLQRLLRRDSLLHLLQRPIRARLSAKEDHGAATAAQRFQRCIRVARHHVHARLAPPAEAQWCEPFCQLARVIFTQEEVHVVELHGIGAILRNQMLQDRGRSLRTLESFARTVSGVDSAETAAEGAADAGVVNRGTFAEERRPQVFLRRARDGTASTGNVSGPFITRSGLWQCCAGAVFVRQARNRTRIRATRAAHPAVQAACLRPVRERHSRHRLRSALRQHRSTGKYPPHTIGTCGRRRRISRLVSMAAAICGPGMQVTPSISTSLLVDQLKDAARRIVIDIAVNDGVLLRGLPARRRARARTTASDNCAAWLHAD